MEITWGELMILKGALVDVKVFFKKLKDDTSQLQSKVEEAHQIIFNKIDRDPFELGGLGGQL
jgi:hypothetical protein